LGTGFFVLHQKTSSAVDIVEFVSGRMSYILVVLRGGWCSVIVLNVHTPNEEKSDSKDSFYEELEQVLIIFLSII
jgi:hypothetical protein